MSPAPTLTTDLSSPRALAGRTVRPVGLGCMNLNHGYSCFLSDEDAVTMVRTALDAGVDHFDTATLYGAGRNEELVGRALGARRKDVFLASKGGLTGASKDSAGGIDGRPETLRHQVEDSLRRLSTDFIDLYYLHRLDSDVPVEESAGALAELVRAGKIGAYGLSEVSAATLERAHAVHPVAAVQNEYSLWTRNPEWGLLNACRRTGAALVAFSPVGRGFLTGTVQDPAALPQGDMRHRMPRFSAEHYPANLSLLEPFRAEAERLGTTIAALSIAWVLAQGPDVLAIPGTTSAAHLAEDRSAEQVILTAEDVARIDAIINHGTVHGHRYAVQQRASIDTEDEPATPPEA
ncbi:aldo/keto reductase [Citricoccus zhacaiensis]|uniref:Aldo/keto reductase n=1 Tax=Citricoccus zhacaiensis TaxID=489142 RepID=A0ABQ2LQ48_9MICC|nr:aldo/keto reductase [Citricoccus zhacaiensis]GGO41742.1 aldo/keto reductase [Citricoccus zhacaiensis]